MDELVKQYLASLSHREKQTYEIAKEYLGSLFDITKSNGFLAWKAKHGK